jgi:four helix bundle protein
MATSDKVLSKISTSIETRNPKYTNMSEDKKTKIYDLEDRTLKFATDTRRFVSQLPKTLINIEDGKQLVRSSGSVGANYIEANEALSKKDFLMRIKICRKEAKESSYWLLLIKVNSVSLEQEQQRLLLESKELTMIFGSILRKAE